MNWGLNWAWASSLDQLWRSPALPMWVTLAAAVFFALVLLVTLLRAEKSVANGALTVITFLAIGIAVAATVRSFGGSGAADGRTTPPAAASLPALSCLDGLAGDAVEAACEKALFSTAESSAAAVSYTAAQITRLASFGDEAAAGKVMTPELSALRRTVERDRYGLVAHVLSVRDGCAPADCAFYKSLSDHNQIAANMTDRTYEGLIGRYALAWNGPPSPTTGMAAGAPLPASVPTGRPMSGDFPSSTSIPPVSIMTPEPSTSAAKPAVAATTSPKPPSPPPATAPAAAPRAASAPPAPKKQAAKKNAVAPAPVPLAPPAATEDN
jgi:hypothetical protein